MKRVFAVAAAVLLFASLGLASYTYFITENLYTPNWSNWNVTGTMTPAWFSSGGYGGIGGYNNGTMMTTGGYLGGEVRMTIRLDPSNPNGTFTALINDWNTGFGEVGYHANISCGTGSALLYVDRGEDQIVYGTETAVWTRLTTLYTTCHDGMVMRTIVTSSSLVLVYIDNVLIVSYQDSSGAPVYGPMGIGVSGGGSTGTLMSEADLGPLDTTAPNAIPSTSIGVGAYTNHVDLSWPAGTDNTNGIGVYGYQVWRNGVLLTTTTGLSYSDTTVVPTTTYSYALKVIDFHGNIASTTFSVTTPHVPTNPPFPSVTPDGRRVGTRPTGAYWGGGTENIDVLSGNLNFALPLLKAQSRGGGGIGFNLVYDSQNWRQDSGGAWNFGGDVGYGYGWKLLAGSITPVWNPGGLTAAYYLFTDSSGAEYRLDQNSGTIWSSKESIYVYFDANTNLLHLRDGTFWNFGCISASTEADSGVMHPTLIEDTNGNQILIRYQSAPGAPWANSSARITQIEDVRATNRGGGVYASYDFTYNSDPIPHLTGITNSIGTGEKYTFSYLGGQPVYSPISGGYFGTTTFLSTAAVSTINMTHTFTYANSGELTKVFVPYGGYYAYDYTTTTYSANSTSYREVAHRYLSKDGTLASQLTYPITHEPTPTGVVHAYTILDDPSGTGEKYWAFGSSGASLGLMTQYQGRQLPGPTAKTQTDLTWAQDGVGNSYIATTLSTLDPGQTYQAQKKTTQTVDNYGNVTQVQNFGNNILG